MLLSDFVRLYCLMKTGPKQSTPVIVNSGLNTAILSFGKFPISCGFGDDLRYLHNKHVDKTVRMIDFPLTIQYFSRNKANV